MQPLKTRFTHGIISKKVNLDPSLKWHTHPLRGRGIDNAVGGKEVGPGVQVSGWLEVTHFLPRKFSCRLNVFLEQGCEHGKYQKMRDVECEETYSG